MPRPSRQEVVDMMLLHARLQLQIKGDYIGIREIRKHAAWYTAGYKSSSKLRGKINEVESYAQLEALLEQWLAEENTSLDNDIIKVVKNQIGSGYIKNILNGLCVRCHRLIHWLQQFIDKWNAGRRAKKPNGTLMDEVEDVSVNPWIYATREVIEQILLYRGRISGHRVEYESDICKRTGEEVLESKAAERHDLMEAYREFRPMILDTDSPEQVFGEEDDVDQI